MNYAEARENMVSQQLRTWDVFDPRVLDLFATLPREDFVPDNFRHSAYSDTPIPLENGHFLAPPREQARMLQALSPQPQEHVLEIGTGAGLMTWMLAKLARAVVTVDIDLEMSRLAEKHLQEMLIHNVIFKVGDGARGWTEDGPFDIICIHGSVKNLADIFKQTLNLHGRLFVVTGDNPAMSATIISRVTENEWQSKVLFETVAPRLVHGEPKPEFEF